MLYTKNGAFEHLSVLGLGCWNFGGQWNKTSEEEAIKIIRYAIDHGVNYVDVAESYGIPDGQCEMILGKALRNGYRDKVFLISKVGWYGRREADVFTAKKTRYDRIMQKIYNKLNHFKSVNLETRTPELVRLCGHASCGRLGTNCIDLLLCHDGNPADPMAFIEGFRQLKKEGFILHYGISTDNLAVLRTFYELSDGECAACECDYSLLNRTAENGIFKFCKEKNIAIFTRGTLSRGLLSGKYTLNTHFNEISRLDWNVGGRNRWIFEHYLKQIAKIRNVIGSRSLPEVAYRFAFSRPEHPTVVIGCTTMQQIEENIHIGESYLEDEMCRKIEDVNI